MNRLVSVVMCTYNGARYLRPQLDSLLAQTYPLHEIIVQDDGSSDETWEILEEYAVRSSLLHIYRNAGPQGINGNFFSAMQRATGEFIAVSDQDDIWEPQKIAWQMEAIGGQLMCGGFSKPFSSDGFPVRWDSRRPCLHLLRLCFLSEIPGHVQLFRRSLLQLMPEVGTLPYLYDWQLQTAAAAAEGLVFTDKVLVNFRRHVEAATATRPVTVRGKGAWQTLSFLIRHYRALHAFAAERFRHIGHFLDLLEEADPELFDTESVRQARQLVRLECASGPLAFLRLMLFCLRHRDCLYHTVEPRRWKASLRALYFPLYSLNYYRGIVRKS